jgi:hypothetical protein
VHCICTATVTKFTGFIVILQYTFNSACAADQEKNAADHAVNTLLDLKK